MLNLEDKDSPRQRREWRRRRLAMRRKLSSTSSNSRQNNNTTTTNNNLRNLSSMANPIRNLNINNNSNFNLVPVVGCTSVAGRQREMEDTISVRLNLCRPEAANFLPIHFIAIFDGHGGRHVSIMCREKLHMLLKEELMHVGNATTTGEASGSNVASSTGGAQEPELTPIQLFMRKWETALETTFERMDEVVRGTCDCGAAIGYNCECDPAEVALCGSTAVVVILTSEYIIVANCGDSRAILCRGGIPIPLSNDHKTSRPDERARIEASGGRVMDNKGLRVEGILAMTRAIGDMYLKPYVTSEPEITFTRRHPSDECLILASDGLWDVMSNGMAAEVARHCLREDEPIGGGGRSFYQSQSASAAALLVRLALGRHSGDNISGIVVDLKRVESVPA